jgi:hypothetical protein
MMDVLIMWDKLVRNSVSVDIRIVSKFSSYSVMYKVLSSCFNWDGVWSLWSKDLYLSSMMYVMKDGVLRVNIVG